LASVLAASALCLAIVCPLGAETQSPPQPQDVILCKVEQYREAADCLQRMKGLVVRTGDTLRLSLGNGRTKVYTSDHQACEDNRLDKCVVHLLLRYYPGIQSFLISTSFYECGHYDLVNRRTGSVLELSAFPKISPRGKYIVSTDTSDACKRDYDIGIWSTRTDPPAVELMYHAKGYENWEVTGWEDDDHIRLKAFISSREGRYDQEAEAVRSADGWKLVLGQRAKRVEQIPEPKH
jgi:hypothetical protein